MSICRARFSMNPPLVRICSTACLTSNPSGTGCGVNRRQCTVHREAGRGTKNEDARSGVKEVTSEVRL